MSKQPPAYQQIALVLVIVFLLHWILVTFSSLLIPLVFSLVIALLLYPVCRWLERKRVPRGLAIVVSILGIITILGGVMYLLTNEIIRLSSELPEMQARIEVAFDDLQAWIERRFDMSPEAQIDWISMKATEFLESSGDYLGGFINATTGFLIAIGIIPFYIFFILYYRDLIKEFAYNATSEVNHENVTVILTNIQKVVQHYLTGLSIVICIVFVMNYIALLLIGVEHALLFAVLAALLTAIPYIGVFIGSMLPALYSLAMTGGIVEPLLIYGAFTVIQNIEANIITPKITGGRVSINPLTAIIALLFGGMVWGVMGMIMFIPLVAIVKVVFDNIEPLKPYGLLLGVPKKKQEIRNRWLEMLGKGNKESKEQNYKQEH
jgi:predicted PurR-regulated permease PerM